MTTHQKILPPPELSPRVVPRPPDGQHVAVADSRRSDIQAAVIRWRNLVLAAWDLPAGEEYTGELPAGLSSQQFWAKVTRAARALGGAVGVATRGNRWWVWAVKRGSVRAEKHAELLQRLESEGMVRLGYEPLASERASIRNAGARRGMRVRFERGADGAVVVNNMGAVKRRARHGL